MSLTFYDLITTAAGEISDVVARDIVSSSSLREKFTIKAEQLVVAMTLRLKRGESKSVFPLRNILVSILNDFNFSYETLIPLFNKINAGIVSFIRNSLSYDAIVVQEYEDYFAVINASLEDFNFLSESGAVSILRAVAKYQINDQLVEFYPKEIDKNNRIFTLFDKSAYFESYENDSTARKSVDLRNRAIIFDHKLYKLAPKVAQPTFSRFAEEEWIEYNSRRFNKEKSFASTYTKNIKAVLGSVVSDGFAANAIISDSHVDTFSDFAPEQPLSKYIGTFGGAGAAVMQAVNDVQVVSDIIGGYEGSIAGGIDYVATVSEQVIRAAFGQNYTGGGSTFGKFNLIFEVPSEPNTIAGLKFLEPFAILKSFVHNSVVKDGTINDLSVSYNPISSRFSNGLLNRFNSLNAVSSYDEYSNVDFVLFSLESLYVNCRTVGDLISTGLFGLDKYNRTPGYEGLGDIKQQLLAMQEIFPPGTLFDNKPTRSSGPGVTGALKAILDNYIRLTSNSLRPVLPAKPLESFTALIIRLRSKIEVLFETISNVGGSLFIPDISFKNGFYKKEDLISFFRGIGYHDSEIEELLAAENFSDLIKKFAPLSDSADVQSFFKAFELTQLVHDIGGQDGIDAYINWLYSRNDIKPLLNVLHATTKNQSKLAKYKLEKYPKLIGLLIGMTYAIDPAQLIIFNDVLSDNYLSLLESVTLLIENNSPTVIKQKSDISLLSPMVEQMIQGHYQQDYDVSPSINYCEVRESAPIALKRLVEQLGDNLGKSDKSVITHLLDRSVGLTPKELLTALNNPQAPTELSVLLDGFSGGEFAKFLQYVNISGLGFKLSEYRNSHHLDNFAILPQSAAVSFIPDLINTLKNILSGITLFRKIFDLQLDFDISTEPINATTLLFSAQNKEFKVLTELATKDLSQETLGSFVDASKIQESPGIGNSRLPNRVPVNNSLTSEQAAIFVEQQKEVMSLIPTDARNYDTIARFVRISQDNRLASNIDIPVTEKDLAASSSGAAANNTAAASAIAAAVATGTVIDTTTTAIAITTSSTRPSVVDDDEKIIVASSGLGANYITPVKKYTSTVENFDRVASCKRFSPNNLECQNLVDDSGAGELCVGTFNKSLLPEEYRNVPGSSETTISIDRPLGTFARYQTSTLVPTTEPPAFYNLLPSGTQVGPGGEPLVKMNSTWPEKSTVKYSLFSAYNSTEFALTQFIRSKMGKATEFECASFESPLDYQLCMNLLKCAKYTPTNGKTFLSFCPRSTAGGRLRP